MGSRSNPVDDDTRVNYRHGRRPRRRGARDPRSPDPPRFAGDPSIRRLRPPQAHSPPTPRGSSRPSLRPPPVPRRLPWTRAIGCPGGGRRGVPTTPSGAPSRDDGRRALPLAEHRACPQPFPDRCSRPCHDTTTTCHTRVVDASRSDRQAPPRSKTGRRSAPAWWRTDGARIAPVRSRVPARVASRT